MRRVFVYNRFYMQVYFIFNNVVVVNMFQYKIYNEFCHFCATLRRVRRYTLAQVGTVDCKISNSEQAHSEILYSSHNDE